MWLGAVNRGGYGQYEIGPRKRRKGWLAHRLVAHLLGFPLGPHMHHLCGVKLCVDPLHLVPISVAEHARHHSRKTHCKHGHSLADAYRGTRSNGKRYVICRTCKLSKLRR